ncbi:PD-(D/E)XK nuclease family protein [Streptomyces sp. NPDC057509]|uniref:PD-(D/E)XK nuclease family protein n=1 Tax=Streptomyces sp. NPDC057509 TaxID=3346152 RepID=UPI00368309E3
MSTIKRGGSRFYVNPDDSRIKVPGVTSIIDQLPKDFLKYWAVKLTAEACVDNRDVWIPLAERDPKGAIDYLKGVHRRVSGDAADIGSAAHTLFERLIRGEVVHDRHVHVDVKPHVRWFREWLEEMQPELVYAEETVWSDAHAYAGSFDLIAKVGGELVMIDFKTSKAVYDSVALQLAAYRYADRILLSDTGESVDVPAMAGGAVLHVRPEGWQFVPLTCDEDVFQKFLALREVFDWSREQSKDVVGKPIASGGERATGTERRAA